MSVTGADPTFSIRSPPSLFFFLFLSFSLFFPWETRDIRCLIKIRSKWRLPVSAEPMQRDGFQLIQRRSRWTIRQTITTRRHDSTSHGRSERTYEDSRTNPCLFRATNRTSYVCTYLGDIILFKINSFSPAHIKYLWFNNMVSKIYTLRFIFRPRAR